MEWDVPGGIATAKHMPDLRLLRGHIMETFPRIFVKIYPPSDTFLWKSTYYVIYGEEITYVWELRPGLLTFKNVIVVIEIDFLLLKHEHILEIYFFGKSQNLMSFLIYSPCKITGESLWWWLLPWSECLCLHSKICVLESNLKCSRINRQDH